MSWISEAQKHYEEYVDYYTSLLDTYIDDRILEMAPAYGQLQEMAINHLEYVAKKYVDEQNPDFIPTRRWAKKIQEEYLTKIIPELNLLNAKLQPFATSVICGTVFYGANTTAYILNRLPDVPLPYLILRSPAYLVLLLIHGFQMGRLTAKGYEKA